MTSTPSLIEFTILKNDQADRDRTLRRAIVFLQGLPLGTAFKVKVEPLKPKRSEQQNRYLWGVCYAELKKVLPGWDAEDIHEYMLGEHFGWERLDGFSRPRLKPVRRSSSLNKQEFTDFVAFVQRKAAEHGCFIPDAQLAADEEQAA